MSENGDSHRGTSTRAWLASSALAILASAPGVASAGQDYDPQSTDWNGLGRLSDIAREEGIELEAPRVLDWDRMPPETGVLIVFPTTSVSRRGLVAHLQRGGRALVADDYGAADEVLATLGVERVDQPIEGGLHFRDVEHLPVAAPVDEEHVLCQGVRRLVANHASTFTSDLPGVFVTGEPPRTLAAVGAVGPGRLVLLGDPSVLINNMLELRGNERFARNLMGYLAGETPPRRLVLVSGRFAQRVGGEAVTGAAAAARRELNTSLLGLSDLLRPSSDEGAPLWLLLLSAVVASASLGLLLFRLGPRPRVYKGLWLRPLQRQRAAGFVGTVEYLGGSDATHVYPLLILKRELEARLLDGLGLPVPSKLDAVLKAYAEVERSPARQRALERLLKRLGGIASVAMASGSPLKVSRRELRQTMDHARDLLKAVGRDIEEPTESAGSGPQNDRESEKRR